MYLFKKKTVSEPVKGTPRGVLPTYVTDQLIVLSKVAPSIRNTYEIRLALFMAESQNLRFVLAVRPGTRIEASVRKLLDEHGGTVEETQLEDYCVYFGWGFEEGEEEGWVLGDAAAFATLMTNVRSPHLKAALRVGANISGPDLTTLAADLSKESISATNIDHENVRDAMLALAADATRNGGTFFVQ